MIFEIRSMIIFVSLLMMDLRLVSEICGSIFSTRLSVEKYREEENSRWWKLRVHEHLYHSLRVRESLKKQKISGEKSWNHKINNTIIMVLFFYSMDSTSSNSQWLNKYKCCLIIKAILQSLGKNLQTIEFCKRLMTKASCIFWELTASNTPGNASIITPFTLTRLKHFLWIEF